MSAQAKPFLRWAGSKRKQLPILAQYWDSSFKRYVEPFMGSACLFFKLGPSRALLSDINRDLINTFNAVKDHPVAVYNRFSKIPLGKQSYYQIRSLKMEEVGPLDAAANFIFLNRYCFNGLYRTNLDGQFNVPYAPLKTGQLPSRSELRSVSNLLQNCKIKRSDFATTLKKTREGDFVNLDPPYAVGNRRIFRQYDPSSFGLDDLERLAAELTAMDKRAIKFVVSYADCREAREHFGHWDFQRRLVQRNIAGFSTARRKSAELIFTNIKSKNIKA